MNDVLAKPFTKDGMVRILKKHLTYLLRDPPPPGTTGMPSEDLDHAGGRSGTPSAGGSQSYHGQTVMNLSHMVGPPMAGGPTVKFEQTPIQSPATTASWHSPNQMSHTSPHLDTGGYLGAVGSGPGSMVLTPGGTQRPQYPTPTVPPSTTPVIGRMPDDMSQGDERPDKRQRIFGPARGTYVQ